MVLESSSSPSTIIIASDANIKNNVTTLISHMYIYNRLITKMIHHAVHVTSTEAELFAIRCSINQALNFKNMSKIIVITNSIHVARKIFEPSVYPYQIQSAAILSDLHSFFKCHENNSIEFWECSSCLKWHLYNKVNEETKTFNPTSLYLCKTSWDFSKKSKSDDILNIIEPSYVKGGSWLKTFGHSNSLCVHATGAITNHGSISKYRLRFFPREEFKCLCGFYPIESRHYILHECDRFNGYWNLRRDSLSYFVMFLVTNPSAFTFSDSVV